MLKRKIRDATDLFLIEEFDRVLRLSLIDSAKELKENSAKDIDTSLVEELIEKRQQARANKDWATADAIRDKLNEMNIIIKDTPDGITWSVK